MYNIYSAVVCQSKWCFICDFSYLLECGVELVFLYYMVQLYMARLALRFFFGCGYCTVLQVFDSSIYIEDI